MKGAFCKRDGFRAVVITVRFGLTATMVHTFRRFQTGAPFAQSQRACPVASI